MTHQTDDIRRYIILTESSRVSQNEEDAMLENIEIPNLDVSGPLLEDVSDMIFKFRSYGEPDGTAEYKRGVEEGLALAANMLQRLLERHSGHSSK